MPVRRFLALVIVLDLALFAALAAGVLALGDGRAVTGALAGGGLGTLNLAGLAWLCGRLVAPAGRRWPYAVLLALKFAAMIGLVYLAVRHLDMNVIWFVVGLSAAGIAVVAGAAYLALRDVELRL